MPAFIEIDWASTPLEGRESSLPAAHLAAISQAVDTLAIPVTHIRLLASPLGRYSLSGTTLEATFDPVLPPPSAEDLTGLLATIL
jgi:hypothetical protein